MENKGPFLLFSTPLSNEAIAFDRDRILTIMTTTTLSVVLCRLGYYQGYFNRVS